MAKVQKNAAAPFPLARPQDQLQRPEELARVSLNTLGARALKESGGYLYEEFLPKLRGQNGAKLYAEMENNSSVLGTVRWVFRALITQLTWEFAPRKGTGSRGREAAEFAESLRDDMRHSWVSMLHDIVTMFTFGWALMEVTYKVRCGPDFDDPRFHSQYTDGRYGWGKIELRPQESLLRWEFDRDSDELLGMHQFDSYHGKQRYIPMSKALLFRTEATKGNPEGRSMLRNCVVDYHYSKRMMEVEAIGAERDLNGVPDMQVPPDMLMPSASPEQKALLSEIETMLAEIKMDERAYVLRPSEFLPGTDKQIATGFKFGLLSASGTRQVDTGAIIARYEARMLRSVLLQFLVIGSSAAGGTGGLGGSGTALIQNNLFVTAFKSFADGICEVFNREALPRLFALNGLPLNLTPHLTYKGLEGAQLTEIADFVQKLVSATVITPTKSLERELLKRAGLPYDHLEDADVSLEDAETADDMLAAIGYNEDGTPVDSAVTLSRTPSDSETGATETVSDVQLNGAQIQAVIESLMAVSGGQIPRATAVLLVQSLGVPPALSEQIVGEIGRSFVATPAPSPFGPVATPTPPEQDSTPTQPQEGQTVEELVAASGFTPPGDDEQGEA